MLKGLKIHKPAEEKQKKWEKDYTNIVTTEELHHLHQKIMKAYALGNEQELRRLLETKNIKEKMYYEQQLDKSSSFSFPMLRNQQKVRGVQVTSSGHNQIYEQPPTNKKERKARERELHKFLPSNRIVDNCPYCPDNEEMLILSSSQYAYLALPKVKRFRSMGYFYICPVQHVSSSLRLENDAYEEIVNYKKCLIRLFDSMNKHVIFFETCNRSDSHLFIECLALPLSKAQDLPIFFKQGLREAEGDWGTNKSIIEVRKEKGGLLKQIPRNFKYFYVDFSLGYGYAHLIEEQQHQWRALFAHQILASMLGLQQHEVMSNEEWNEEQLEEKAQQFRSKWKPFDWTTLL